MKTNTYKMTYTAQNCLSSNDIAIPVPFKQLSLKSRECLGLKTGDPHPMFIFPDKVFQSKG